MSAGADWQTLGLDWPNREASRFVDSAGLRWHVQQMGRGETLLLVHGTGASTHSWRDVAPLLARHYHVLAPDLPGHAFTSTRGADGQSLPAMAAALAELLRTLDVTPRWVVGHSAGAAILARLCIDQAISPRLFISLNGALLPLGKPSASCDGSPAIRASA